MNLTTAGRLARPARGDWKDESYDPAIDMKAAVRKQVNDLDIDAYFNTLAQLMKTNTATSQLLKRPKP